MTEPNHASSYTTERDHDAPRPWSIMKSQYGCATRGSTACRLCSSARLNAGCDVRKTRLLW